MLQQDREFLDKLYGLCATYDTPHRPRSYTVNQPDNRLINWQELEQARFKGEHIKCLLSNSPCQIGECSGQHVKCSLDFLKEK